MGGREGMGSAHLFIGMKVISWLVGIVVFYLFANRERSEKKYLLQEVTSQLVNFILFIWLGKIVLNFSSFIKSPVVILAYPSNAQSFYLATFLTVVLITYKRLKNNYDVHSLIEAFMYVFLVASLTYDFIQIILNHSQYVLGQFIMLAILVLVYIFLEGPCNAKNIGLIMLVLWSLGALVLQIIQPFFIVFGYTIAPLFFVIVFIGSMGYLIFTKRKKVL